MEPIRDRVRESELSQLPPEAIARIEREARAREEQIKTEKTSARVGYSMMGLGTLAAVVPILVRGDISVVAGAVGIAVIIAGGIVNDPKNWGRIAKLAFDALPGGKR